MNLRLYFFLIAAMTVISSMAIDDNVVVRELNETYTVQADKGLPSSVKKTEELTFVASRADDVALAVTFYDEDSKIDKASAPGGIKPFYTSWESNGLFHTGARICAFKVPLKKDKPAKVTFEQTLSKPEKFTEIYLLTPGYSVQKATYTVNVPAQLADYLTLTPKYLPEGVKMDCATNPKGDKIYTVTILDYPEFKAAPFCSSPMYFAPRIEITGYFNDSQALYDYLHGKIEAEEPSEAISTLTESLCNGADNDIEKINRIAAWVRNNIRYVAIEHGEYGFRPVAADEVLRKRFADCKGSANLIRLMLRSAGFDGRLVWIGTRGDVTGSWSDKPTISAGNHMIAAAVLPDTTIFIDGTVSFAPAGLIPSSIAGQECMIENGSSPLITFVPAQAPCTNRINLTGTATIEADGLKGSYNCEFTGEERVRLENIVSALSKAKRTAAIASLLEFNRKGVRIDSAVLADSETQDAQSSTVSFSEVDPAGLRSLSGGKKYVILKPLRATGYSKVDLNERRLPVMLGRNKNLESRITFEIPDNMTLESLPDPTAINSDWFEGAVEFTQTGDGKNVICKAWLNQKKTDGDAASWNKAIDQLEAASNTPIILTTN